MIQLSLPVDYEYHTGRVAVDGKMEIFVVLLEGNLAFGL
jgi:hypothetical protein